MKKMPAGKEKKKKAQKKKAKKSKDPCGETVTLKKGKCHHHI